MNDSHQDVVYGKGTDADVDNDLDCDDDNKNRNPGVVEVSGPAIFDDGFEAIPKPDWSSVLVLVFKLAKFFFYDTLHIMNTEQMVTELFDVFDVNSDGVISRGEFKSLIESLLQQQGMNFSSDIFKQFDTNHDNVISKDELVEMVLELAL